MYPTYLRVIMQGTKEPSDFFYLTPEVTRRKRSYKVLYILVILGVAVCLATVLALYFKRDDINIGLFDKDDKSKVEPKCSGIPDVQKFDCYPDAPVTEAQCLNRGCCYAVSERNASSSLPPLSTPYCFYPSNYVGYVISNVIKYEGRIIAKLKRTVPSGFPRDVKNLNLLITFIDDQTLRIKITDADSQRYEVPIPLHYQTKTLNKPDYTLTLDSKTGFLEISRNSTGVKIFSTNLSNLVYSDQFLQISSQLPSTNIYGIGEHYGSVLRSVNWTRLTLFNSDLEPIPNHSLYGSQPFYMVLEEDGKANGVFLFNSNPMDVILQPTPAITLRPIGGILDFFIMLGPTPENVAQQFASIVGKTFMPPYWSLGFHLCRYGYNSLNKTREVMQRTVDAQIPLDVQWNDIDYMDKYKDFTYDKDKFAGLPEFVDELHQKGMRYVIMTDPGISAEEKLGTYPPYDEGVDDGIFVKNANGSIFIGKVWTGGNTVFPDFSHPAATSYWTRQFKRFYDEVKYDGVWIDMNEPSNFLNGDIDGCPNSTLENPQYVPGGVMLRTKTLCMTSKHYYTVHYNEHNIYAYREAAATNQALKTVRKKRPFIISRATFSGQGVQSGHWSGDIASVWEDMRYTIPSMINFNMYAMPMIGSDICGFNGNTTVELCARWQALGAFYPFSRNHNERVTIEQDPVALGPLVEQATRMALRKRYMLLPYLYTLFYRSHAFGSTVIRPLFFEFPEDPNTHSMDEQFLWGSSLLVNPALYPNITSIKPYFPKGIWYQDSGELINSTGQTFTFPAPTYNLNLALRGGLILPLQNANTTTTSSRKNPFFLLAALDENNESSGELYWDDGDSLDTYENGYYNLIQFSIKSNVLKSTVVKQGFQTKMDLVIVQVLGLKNAPTSVDLNGVKCRLVNETRKIDEKFAFFGFSEFPSTNLPANEQCVYLFDHAIFSIQMNNLSFLSNFIITWAL